MIGVLIVTILQAVAGDVAPPPAAPETTVSTPVDGTTAPEATPEAAPTPQPVQTTERRERCRYEAVTGSNLRRRVCRTEEQTQADSEAAQRSLEAQRRTSGALPQGF